MIEVSEIEIYRDGGTIEFRLSGSEADGFYHLQTPALGVPEPLFLDGERLSFGSKQEGDVLHALQFWLVESITPDVAVALAELKATKPWLNLPDRLSNVVPFYYVQIVASRLHERHSIADV